MWNRRKNGRRYTSEVFTCSAGRGLMLQLRFLCRSLGQAFHRGCCEIEIFWTRVNHRGSRLAVTCRCCSVSVPRQVDTMAFCPVRDTMQFCGHTTSQIHIPGELSTVHIPRSLPKLAVTF